MHKISPDMVPAFDFLAGEGWSHDIRDANSGWAKLTDQMRAAEGIESKLLHRAFLLLTELSLSNELVEAEVTSLQRYVGELAKNVAQGYVPDPLWVEGAVDRLKDHNAKIAAKHQELAVILDLIKTVNA